jgi:hypothetical protein
VGVWKKDRQEGKKGKQAELLMVYANFDDFEDFTIGRITHSLWQLFALFLPGWSSAGAGAGTKGSGNNNFVFPAVSAASSHPHG